MYVRCATCLCTLLALAGSPQQCDNDGWVRNESHKPQACNFPIISGAANTPLSDLARALAVAREPTLVRGLLAFKNWQNQHELLGNRSRLLAEMYQEEVALRYKCFSPSTLRKHPFLIRCFFYFAKCWASALKWPRVTAFG